MPTRTIDTQTFEGETIQCAKFVSDEPFSWKAAQIVQAECDYEFQMVAKSLVATTLTIQVGDTVKTQAITTEFTRFVIPFPSVTNDVDSLYITFPSGTYWLYNLQLERASTPSAWRPAPEDAEDYADKVAQQAVDDQTQLDVFNKLTNNGASQGIYLLDGQLYINGEYIAANTLSANKIHGGTIDGTDVNIVNLNASNITSGTISASKVTGGTLSGSQINIGNGTFTVNSSGNVVANSLSSSNATITGGSINIDSGTQSIDKINLTYYGGGNNLSSTGIKITMNPTSTRGGYVATMGSSAIDIKFTSVDGNSTQEVQVSTTGVQIKVNGVTRAVLSPGSASGSNASGKLQIYDPNGTNRLWLDYDTGLTFRNASGSITKQYGVS